MWGWTLKQKQQVLRMPRFIGENASARSWMTWRLPKIWTEWTSIFRSGGDYYYSPVICSFRSSNKLLHCYDCSCIARDQKADNEILPIPNTTRSPQQIPWTAAWILPSIEALYDRIASKGG